MGRCAILLKVQPSAHDYRPQKVGKHRQVVLSTNITVEEEGSNEPLRSHSAPNLDTLLAVGISICSSGLAVAQ
jgi:hypothetical protein